MRWERIIPYEENDQMALAEYLDRIRLLWHHSPNGGSRNELEAKKLKAMGVKPGFPDIQIFNPPPAIPGAPGSVIEMKRQEGGRLSEDQKEWLDKLAKLGWATAVCEGIDEALDQLRRWGYK